MVQGAKVRDRGPDDEYAQATLFWNSMSESEQDHIVDAYTFELGHVEVPAVVERMVLRLALVDVELARRVTIGLGLPAPTPFGGDDTESAGPALEAVPDATGGVTASPALAMVTNTAYPVDGRVVQILANDGCDLAGIRSLQAALTAAGAVPHVIATHKGAITGAGRRSDELIVDRSFHTASSAEADAIVVAAGAGLADNSAVLTWVQSAYRHFKPIAAWGDGADLLTSAGIDVTGPGVAIEPKANSKFFKSIVADLSVHRHWERAAVHPTRDPEQAV
jgi:catalase